MVGINEGGTGYSFADRQTGWDVPGLGKHSGWRHPAWVDNDTTMLANPTHLPNHDVILDTLSDGTTGNLVHNWFSDAVEGNPHVSGGDISRDKRKLAFQTGENDSTLTVYSVPAFPTTFRDGDADASTRPSVCYRYSDPPSGKFSQPTFSPDAGRVAWSVSDGIHVAAVPDFGGGCTLDGATPAPPLVIPGGAEPDWGPADVPPARATTQPGSNRARLSVSVTRTTLKKALREGLRLRVDVPAPGRLAAGAKRNGKTIAQGARAFGQGRQAHADPEVHQGRPPRARPPQWHEREDPRGATPKGGPMQTAALSATLKRR